MERSQRERDRIQTEFERRDQDPRLTERYDQTDPAIQLAQRDLRNRLVRRLAPVTDGPSILEVGCGSGGFLRLLQEVVGRSRAVGVDLSFDRLSRARALSPSQLLALADGTALPFPSATFDLVCQSTVVSSILDDAVRRWLAAEMARVLRPGGRLLWYDFIWNPMNRSTRGVGRGEIAALFPGFTLSVERATLAPPLARLFAGRAGAVAAALVRVSALRWHYLALLERQL